MSHLKYEIERIRHDQHDELLKSSPFCSEPAAAVSITCQETPNRTASPFDEAASHTNDIIDQKRFPCDGKSSPLFFAVARQCFRATRNLSRYCNWCSLDCVYEIDLPDFTVAPHREITSSWHREMFWFVSWNSAKTRRGLTGLSLNPKSPKSLIRV